MIARLKGEVLSKSDGAVVLGCGGVGYELNLAQASAEKLRRGTEAELYVCESFSPYEGTILYGFLAPEEKELFSLFRQAVPGTGAKKALEFLNKALKSLPDFERAVLSRDAKLLTGIFGFTSKTAEKLIVSLKDKMGAFSCGGAKITVLDGGNSKLFETLNALTALGYSPSEARKAVEAVRIEGIADGEELEQIVRKALRKLAS